MPIAMAVTCSDATKTAGGTISYIRVSIKNIGAIAIPSMYIECSLGGQIRTHTWGQLSPGITANIDFFSSFTIPIDWLGTYGCTVTVWEDSSKANQITTANCPSLLTVQALPMGTIHANVTDSVTGNPINMAGVQFSLFGCQTDSSGYCRIDNVPVGTYNVDVTAFGYNSSSTTKSVSAGDNNFYFYLTPTAPAFVLEGRVTDAVFGTIVVGAIVEAYYKSDMTDMMGHYRLEYTEGWSGAVTVSKSGYASQTKMISLVPGDNVLDFALDYA